MYGICTHAIDYSKRVDFLFWKRGRLTLRSPISGIPRTLFDERCSSLFDRFQRNFDEVAPVADIVECTEKVLRVGRGTEQVGGLILDLVDGDLDFPVVVGVFERFDERRCGPRPGLLRELVHISA